MTRKYILYSALSGCVWAMIVVALVRGELEYSPGMFTTMALCPLIGVIIGIVYLPAYRLPIFFQFFVSFITLYLGVALFGLGAGLSEILWSVKNHGTGGAVLIQAVYGYIWGITVMGFMLILWPLAFVNHLLLSAAADRHD